MVSTALIGATGASSVLLACTTTFLLMTRLVFKESALLRAFAVRAAMSVLISSVLAMVGSLVGVKKTARQKAMIDKEIQQFYFEDYVHAEKD